VKSITDNPADLERELRDFAQTGDIAKLESRGSRGFREISDFELELASASL
jgi:hypothetical protein